MQVSLGELIADLGGELAGHGVGVADLCFSRIAPLAQAGPDAISFLSHARYAAQLAQSQAGCVIVAPDMREVASARGAALITADPYLYFARLTQWWAARQRVPVEPGVHRLAAVDDGVHLGPGVSIGPFAVIEHGARIGPGAVVGAHAFVGRDAVIGAATRLQPRVTLSAGCRIGDRGLLHSGAVIGADGFGFAPGSGDGAGTWVKIEQLGAVRLGDDVEIGANSCVDRGALLDTVLGNGVKLDNLVQIGHNVVIGDHCAFAGCVGVAGSATIGARCTAGGGAIILGHLSLCDDVHVTAATVITRSIHKPGQYSGLFPFDDNASWEKNAATLRQLHGLRERLRALEKKT
jgi:UDP-3-O-[3-hydroxymyristoyl] glucosamine N-acyltransferase